MSNPVRDALALAGERRAVFPCRVTADGRKVPCCRHGIDDATTDPPAIERLWRFHYGPLIGVRCGRVSDISVLDVDVKHGSARDWWAQNQPALPATRIHRTRSGGVHLIFEHAAGFPTTVGRIVRSVDTRSDGSYVIWWPAAGLPVLRDGPIATLPDWLLDALKPRQPIYRPPSSCVVPDDRRIGKILERLESAVEGEPNSLAFWAATKLREMVGPLLSEAEALQLVIASAMSTGLSYREASATAKSGLRRRSDG